MTVPLAESSTSRAPATSGVKPPGIPKLVPSLTVAVEPRASAIWEATVRFQISS